MEWKVQRLFAPWWRVIQPTALVGGGYWRPRVVAWAPPSDDDEEADKVIRIGTRVVIVILFIISLPQLLFMAVIALLELIALGVVGSALPDHTSTSLVDGPRKYTPANLPANVSVRSHQKA